MNTPFIDPNKIYSEQQMIQLSCKHLNVEENEPYAIDLFFQKYLINLQEAQYVDENSSIGKIVDLNIKTARIERLNKSDVLINIGAYVELLGVKFLLNKTVQIVRIPKESWTIEWTEDMIAFGFRFHPKETYRIDRIIT